MWITPLAHQCPGCAEVSCSNLGPLKTVPLSFSFSLLSFPIPSPLCTHTNPSSFVWLAQNGPAAAADSKAAPCLGNATRPSPNSCLVQTGHTEGHDLTLAAYRKHAYQIQMHLPYFGSWAACMQKQEEGKRRICAQDCKHVCICICSLGRVKNFPTNLALWKAVMLIYDFSAHVFGSKKLCLRLIFLALFFWGIISSFYG